MKKLALICLICLSTTFTACTSSTATNSLVVAKQVIGQICASRDSLQAILDLVRPNPRAEQFKPILEYLHTTCPFFFASADPELYRATLNHKGI